MLKQILFGLLKVITGLVVLLLGVSVVFGTIYILTIKEFWAILVLAVIGFFFGILAYEIGDDIITALKK